MRSWAQHGEDLTIARLLGDKWFNRGDGYFCDVGAWSDNIDSVSRMYYDRGWFGINIEPVTHYYKQLVATRPRDINLHCAVGANAERSRPIHVIAGTGLSTLCDDFDPGPYQDFYEEVEVRTLGEICATHPCPPDRFFGWMKIDVEGFELPVISGADWKHHRPRVVCAEADHGDYREWEAILVAHNYRYVESDNANRFYILATE
jgi:FkbM family methyltransferase